MSNAFADIAFTPSVKTTQSRYGGRAGNSGFERANNARAELTLHETRFIAERDSFYQATISESGWPYVQHRGGPVGFLRVLDARTIGYADFRGNLQYLSAGNLAVNKRVSLILVDYVHRARLKIWGCAHIVHGDDNPDLMTRLELPGYRARIERGIVIQIEAWDWNCPQHITQRFSKSEVEELMAALRKENQQLKAQLDAVRIARSPAAPFHR